MKHDKAKNLYEIIDIFKITNEQSNFKPIMIESLAEDNVVKHDYIEPALYLTSNKYGKYYYFTLDDNWEFISLNFGTISLYYECEIITLIIKLLANLDMYETKVILTGKNESQIIENLETIDVEASIGVINKYLDYDEDLSFDITYKDKIVAHGGSNYQKNISYFKMNYKNIDDFITLNIPDTTSKILVKPESKIVLDDAFIISTELKDGGFTVETDYELSAKIDTSFNFIIRFNEEDIKNFEVRLKDCSLNEEKKIKIDSLTDELSYM